MNFVIVNFLVSFAFMQGITGVLSQLDKELGLASPLELYAGANSEANCTGRTGNVCGLQAADCTSVFLCIPSLPDPIKSPCKEGLFCNEGVCSTVKSPFCEYGDRPFRCNTQGMYPEPSSCQKFNYCVPNTAGSTPSLVLTPSECEEGWGFNPATASCDKKLTNNTCAATDRPVPSCLALGQNGALKNNPSMYYICTPYDSPHDLELYPYIFKCEGNKKYVQNTYECK